LSYHGARYYAPWLGRWSSSDPLGIEAGPNVYQYVSDNPLTLIDPTGLDGSLWDQIGAAKEFWDGLSQDQQMDAITSTAKSWVDQSVELSKKGGAAGVVTEAMISPTIDAAVDTWDSYQELRHTIDGIKSGEKNGSDFDRAFTRVNLNLQKLQGEVGLLVFGGGVTETVVQGARAVVSGAVRTVIRREAATVAAKGAQAAAADVVAAETRGLSASRRVNSMNTTGVQRRQPPNRRARTPQEAALRDRVRDDQMALGDRLEELGLPRNQIPQGIEDEAAQRLINSVRGLQRVIGRLRARRRGPEFPFE
jgi:hypothetical protein